MRVSLSVAAKEGVCSKCGAGPVLVLPFMLVADDHAGEADALCGGCLFDAEGLRVDVPMEALAPGPVNRRKGLRKARKASLRQEVDIAEQLDGRTQPGSGNQPGAKGDVRVRGRMRVEAKCTTAKSYSLHLEDLYKIAGEVAADEMPIFVIDYLEQGTSKLLDRFAVLHFKDLKELLNDASKDRGPQRTR